MPFHLVPRLRPWKYHPGPGSQRVGCPVCSRTTSSKEGCRLKELPVLSALGYMEGIATELVAILPYQRGKTGWRGCARPRKAYCPVIPPEAGRALWCTLANDMEFPVSRSIPSYLTFALPPGHMIQEMSVLSPS